MQAGKLSERVTLQHFVEMDDPVYGPQPGEWVTLYEVWADVRFLSGSETIKAGAELASTAGSVRIRRRPTKRVTPGMRLVHGGIAYNITAVLPNHRQAYIDLLVKTTGETP